MIGLILAAGRGSRLGQACDGMPKCLLPLGDNKQTLLDTSLDMLSEMGTERVLIVTGYEADKIKERTKNRREVELIYNPFWSHCNVLGSMYLALDKISDDFIYLHADTILEKRGWDLLNDCRKADAVIPYGTKPCGEEEMKVIVSGGRVLSISKQINPADATGEFVGIARFSERMAGFFKKEAEQLFSSGNLNYFMESALQTALDDEAYSILPLDLGECNFVEIDFKEDYEEAVRLFGS